MGFTEQSVFTRREVGRWKISCHSERHRIKNLRIGVFFFFSGIFHLILWAHGWPLLTEIMESRTVDQGGSQIVKQLKSWMAKFCILA